jgi:hypothetical protein
VLQSLGGGFGKNGLRPAAGVSADSKGNLFGTTLGGGSFAGPQCKSGGCGVVFELTGTGFHPAH